MQALSGSYLEDAVSGSLVHKTNAPHWFLNPNMVLFPVYLSDVVGAFVQVYEGVHCILPKGCFTK
jgi:hypothetical protein